MHPEALPTLTPAELALIETHLREQYQGVFDDKMIEAHLREYVESRMAENLAAVIADSSQQGTTLLDIGAGYGAFVLSCRRYGLDAKGIEIAAFEIGIARQRLARAELGADPVEVFTQGDAGRLPFADNTFQFVSLLNVIEHVPDYRQVLAEAVRIVRPGGKLLIVCPNYAAFRNEAHYLVPWVPFFPRPLAMAYLRLLGRNPRFFQSYIHYCTNWGVLNALRVLSTRPVSLEVLRLKHSELIASTRAKRIIFFIEKLRMLPILKMGLALNFYNPFKASVLVFAEKQAPA
jgi:SAM-dependent methyltransferase